MKVNATFITQLGVRIVSEKSAGLKPCPFCGGEAEWTECDKYIWCPSCGANGGHYSSDEKNIDAWNKRTETTEQPNNITQKQRYISHE